MSKEIKFEALLDGAAKLLERFPEYRKKAEVVLKAADAVMNTTASKKKKFVLEEGIVNSLVELKVLLNSIPDKSLAKMRMLITNAESETDESISHIQYVYNKDQKDIAFVKMEK